MPRLLSQASNKPNFGDPARGLGLACTNKANLPAGGTGSARFRPRRSSLRPRAFPGRLCKTNPISETWPAGRIPQHSTILSFHHSSPMPIVRNKANFTHGQAAPSLEPNRAKQSQFPQGRSGQGPEGAPAVGPRCTNKGCNFHFTYRSCGTAQLFVGFPELLP